MVWLARANDDGLTAVTVSGAAWQNTGSAAKEMKVRIFWMIFIVLGK